ncbi:sigma factor-like helix-turn-helix DNA-binding protein [Mucisphaera sp.]|uniref:sigma factor-like helix-turn-helix DNA-binding protein n=1 Tax=Mucisphaera sp. TaxID=2913024 RepID=UPI003D10791D
MTHSDPITRATQKNLSARVSQRSHAERVLRLAPLLPSDERLLLEQVYRHGLSIADLARLTGLPPRTLQRRIRNIVKRLNSDLFRFVAAQEDILPRTVRPTARRVAIHGRSLRAAARESGLTLHRVREHMRIVQALARL